MSANSIRNDPFARFERSRGGLLIPIALFFIGAIATVWAARTLSRLNQKDEQARAIQAAAALIQHVRSLPPEEREEFLRNSPYFKIVEQTGAQPANTQPTNTQPSDVQPDVTEPDVTEPVQSQPTPTPTMETQQP